MVLVLMMGKGRVRVLAFALLAVKACVGWFEMCEYTVCVHNYTYLLVIANSGHEIQCLAFVVMPYLKITRIGFASIVCISTMYKGAVPAWCTRRCHTVPTAGRYLPIDLRARKERMEGAIGKR